MISRSFTPLALVAFALLAGCDASETESPVSPDFALSHTNGHSAASGGGQYVLAFGSDDLPGTFSFTATEKPDGTAGGQLRYTLDFFGENIEFHGEVTCLTVDLDNGRAWIGGVVTRNLSDAEPFASGAIFQEGKDIWFRVLDSGEGDGAVDRTTFVGFEGGAGIITSQEYCDLTIWAEGNARTWPVTGSVRVR